MKNLIIFALFLSLVSLSVSTIASNKISENLEAIKKMKYENDKSYIYKQVD